MGPLQRMALFQISDRLSFFFWLVREYLLAQCYRVSCRRFDKSEGDVFIISNGTSAIFV